MGSIAQASREIFTIPEHQEVRPSVYENSLSHLTQRTFASSHDFELYIDPTRMEVYDERDDEINPCLKLVLLIVAIFIFIITFVLGAGNPLIFIGLMALYIVIILGLCHWMNKKEEEMVDEQPSTVVSNPSKKNSSSRRALFSISRRDP